MSEVNAAEQLTLDLRSKFSRHQYTDVYRSSSMALKNNLSENDFVNFMNESSRDLGLLKITKLKNHETKYKSLGYPIIILTYESKYSNSKFIINEIFSFVVENGEIKLLGYHFNKGS
jgi:hypothetical protein